MLSKISYGAAYQCGSAAEHQFENVVCDQMDRMHAASSQQACALQSLWTETLEYVWKSVCVSTIVLHDGIAHTLGTDCRACDHAVLVLYV
jgi:hypothetical protein